MAPYSLISLSSSFCIEFNFSSNFFGSVNSDNEIEKRFYNESSIFVEIEFAESNCDNSSEFGLFLLKNTVLVGAFIGSMF